MTDVQEKHGIRHDLNAVVLTEREDCIAINLFKGEGVTSQTTIYITPNEARHLASKLRRLARRVGERILGR